MQRFVKHYLPTIFGLYYNTLSTVAPELAARQAFRTFTKVRKGRLNDTQEQYLAVARKERLEVHEHEIQVYHWPGKNQRILLVHGWESNTHRWRNLISELRSADFDIIAFDAPGHGASTGGHLHVPLYADCVDVVIDRYEPSNIVGHSVGGMTALYSYSRNRHPEVRKIVTLGSPAEFRDIIDHFQDLLDLKPGLMNALREYVVQEFGLEVDDFSSPAFVKDSEIQGLLFHDRLDPVTPFRASESVHSQWRKSKLIATEGLGHSMHQQGINQQIVDFLQEEL